jgi:hypothetical protein
LTGPAIVQTPSSFAAQPLTACSGGRFAQAPTDLTLHDKSFKLWGISGTRSRRAALPVLEAQ